MRIIYRNFSGRVVVKQFNDWREMCVWLKRYYPFLTAAKELGDFVESL